MFGYHLQQQQQQLTIIWENSNSNMIKWILINSNIISHILFSLSLYLLIITSQTLILNSFTLLLLLQHHRYKLYCQSICTWSVHTSNSYLFVYLSSYLYNIHMTRFKNRILNIIIKQIKLENSVSITINHHGTLVTD